jgi:hypothetical protein
MDTVIPGFIRKIFGKPPIMIGENSATDEELLVSVASEAKPHGLSEYLLVKDIADPEWGSCVFTVSKPPCSMRRYRIR